jgi:hypothetical protein
MRPRLEGVFVMGMAADFGMGKDLDHDLPTFLSGRGSPV